MPKVKFVLGKNIFDITKEDLNINESVIRKYMEILGEKDLIFLYKGKNILENEDILNKIKNKNNIIITVIKKNKIKSDIGNIICPECQELTFLNINEDNIIKLDNCINNHKNEYSINEFIENEEIKENEIKCNICNNSKSLYNNNFYICTCKKNVCQLCMINHIKDKEHNILYYNKRYSFCNKHLFKFVSYCSLCKMNLCINCEKEHENHKNKIILYKKENLVDKKKKEIEKEIKDNIEKIRKYKNEINDINDMFKVYLKKINEELDNYNKLFNKMIIILNNLSNYQNIKNILNFKNLNIIKNINIFLKDDIQSKLKYLINKFYLSESILIYKIDDKKIKLFGNEFVKNNKDNYYLIIDNKKINLCEYYNVKNDKMNKLKVKLIQTNVIENMSFIFSDCTSLSSLSDISKWNTNNVTDMSYIFCECSSLSTLPDISKWNTNNVTDMSYMFYDCESLSSLPDISKWNINNVTNMSYMFYDCESLSSLPDI